MANRRQIPFATWQGDKLHWKPSPRLRKAGWTNRVLGTRADEDAAMRAALEMNRLVAEWDAGCAAVPDVKPVPRKWTFADLVDAYRQSRAFTVEIRPATRREYEVRLRQLLFWAQDGAVPVAALDKAMVADLKDALLAKGGSIHKCASTLRVLRMLLRWAKGEGIVRHDATEGVKIPAPPSRTAKLTWEEVQHVAAIAGTLGEQALGLDVALALEVAFWSMQREADLIAITRMAWRTFDRIDPRDRAALAGPSGDVKGFRVQQGKTGAWVDCPMPPFLHARIEAAFARSQLLFPHPGDPAAMLGEKRWQRAMRAALDAAGWPDRQFRDLRRSGMSGITDMGADRSDVFTISGHAVLGKRTIVDTYMPPDTRAAARAIAAALRTLAARKERDQGNG